ncbi:HAD family hydrolase [Chitinophaga rhizophila]|uniref:Cof-type HAD-IIB family hydrolase n=1 Tax=Chitinophaga rhizophila TaxID=2866212 RepID=A0ABS7GBW0_9BACT|nr:HAD family hydrolase [Chitinophaga rhizophila]MBW8684750.1 Cof-type HAD-IIB family hydrolase [Chitinophaga rhizophila]
MIKLVVTDLDGTLLNDQHEVPERFWDIANRLFKKGIKLGIATGRPHFSITENFPPLMAHVYAISDNGSFIMYDKKEILSKPLPQEEIMGLVKTARGIDNTYPVLCGKDYWFLESEEKVLIEKVLIYQKNIRIVKDLTKVDDPILKMSVLDLNGADQNSYLHYTQFADRLKVALGGALWVDVTRLDANKGEAVQMLQQLNNIGPDETLVFGDFMNDYEMMRAAKYSYAMKNAYPKIIEVANFVTEKDNNEGGVLDVIEALCLR